MRHKRYLKRLKREYEHKIDIVRRLNVIKWKERWLRAGVEKYAEDRATHELIESVCGCPTSGKL
jgi:hypothetical protein